MTKPSALDNAAQRTRILDRIRKLLALGHGTNFEGEAQASLRMAREHMAQYGLSLSDVELAEALADPIVEMDADEHSKRKTPEHWAQILAAAIRIIFDCDCIISTSRMTRRSVLRFVGYKEDVELARTTYTILYLAIRAAACRQISEAGRPRLSFMYGVAERLMQRANAEKKAAKQEPSGRFEMVVRSKAQHVADFIKKQHEDMKPSRARGTSLDYDAYEQGLKHGSRMDMLNRKKVPQQPVVRLEHSRRTQ